MQHNEVVPIPYDAMIDSETGRTEVRMVDISSYRYRSSYKSMARLKPEYACDEALFERLAELTNLTCQAFKERYG